jgi:hypothetical protein
MAYVVFDLDETLAHLHTTYYFIASLRQKEDVMSVRAYLLSFLSRDFFDQVENAYRKLVEFVRQEEASEIPLGILRPGVLEIMKELKVLQQKGKVAYVVIYSNSRYLPHLEFVRDIIHSHVKSTTLIGDCIHWDHPGRLQDKITPGITKSWVTLKDILVQGPCKAQETLEPKDVYFFDDLQHMDLAMHLKEQYYQVPPYNYIVSFDRLSELYAAAVKEANVEWESFVATVSHLVQTNDQLTMVDIIRQFQEAVHRFTEVSDIPPSDDIGYWMMKDALKELASREVTKMRPIKRKRRTIKMRRYTVRK